MATRDRTFMIPGVGNFRPTYDRIEIYSDVSKRKLTVTLPMAGLEASTHKFRLERIGGERDHGCRIKLMCLPDGQALKLLKQYERYLGRYRVTTAEIAADSFDCGNDEVSAKDRRNALLEITNKRNHRRGYVRAIDSTKSGEQLAPEQAARQGLIANDFTVYFEPIKKTPAGRRNKPATDLIIYLRREKMAAGQFGDLGIRLEFKLSRARAVSTHLGGDQIDHLINADFTAIIRKNLILAKVDYAKLGRLLSPRNAMRHGAKRVAYRYITVLEAMFGVASGPMPAKVRHSSPAHIKGLLRQLMKKQETKPGRSSVKRRNRLTMKKLEECFEKIPF